MSQIDHLVLTHTDTDHIGDLEEVAKRFKIKEICVSQGALTKPSFVKRLRTYKMPSSHSKGWRQITHDGK